MMLTLPPNIFKKQCCGWGSGSTGSTCFLGLPDLDPDPLVRGMDPDPDPALDPDPSIIMKNSKKNLESYYFVTLFDFSSLKNDVNVASNSNEQKKLC
jgi:hypothetical protein